MFFRQLTKLFKAGTMTQPRIPTPESPFERELKSLLNRYSKENGSNTPDFILAEYLNGCLGNFNRAVTARNKFYGHTPEPVRYSEEPQCRSCRPFRNRPWKNSELLDIVHCCIEGKKPHHIAQLLFRPESEVVAKIGEIDAAIARLHPV